MLGEIEGCQQRLVSGLLGGNAKFVGDWDVRYTLDCVYGVTHDRSHQTLLCHNNQVMRVKKLHNAIDTLHIPLQEFKVFLDGLHLLEASLHLSDTVGLRMGLEVQRITGCRESGSSNFKHVVCARRYRVSTEKQKPLCFINRNLR